MDQSITPVNDTDPEQSETVILTITSNANYYVGSPNSAQATITDSDCPSFGSGYLYGDNPCANYPNTIDDTYLNAGGSYLTTNFDGGSKVIHWFSMTGVVSPPAASPLCAQWVAGWC